jgi:hypothetical protein
VVPWWWRQGRGDFLSCCETADQYTVAIATGRTTNASSAKRTDTMGKKSIGRQASSTTPRSGKDAAGDGRTNPLFSMAPLVVGCAIGALSMLAVQNMPSGFGIFGVTPHDLPGTSQNDNSNTGGSTERTSASSVVSTAQPGRSDKDIAVDCSGRRFHSAWVDDLWGDGFCDNGWVSVNLSCAEYSWDGGDCDESLSGVYVTRT